ncbi:hypothetical protein CYY_000294 [Polysphondylium violaceum]|uniref:non-specific serine/threonine protein kinase n=1 Tax=Polysphondylium violaceum TaxID=133409 RepID=A0A8J4Q443_9MYCE|nr:hypothetical protein CYY_000294 [Polysphondylium violaceum]
MGSQVSKDHPSSQNFVGQKLSGKKSKNININNKNTHINSDATYSNNDTEFKKYRRYTVHYKSNNSNNLSNITPADLIHNNNSNNSNSSNSNNTSSNITVGGGGVSKSAGDISSSTAPTTTTHSNSNTPPLEQNIQLSSSFDTSTYFHHQQQLHQKHQHHQQQQQQSSSSKKKPRTKSVTTSTNSLDNSEAVQLSNSFNSNISLSSSVNTTPSAFNSPSITPPDSFSFGGSGSSNSNNSHYFSRTRSRSLNLTSLSVNNNNNNSVGNNNNNNNNSHNNIPLHPLSALNNNNSNSNSTSNKPTKIEGRKTKSSTALFKSLTSSLKRTKKDKEKDKQQQQSTKKRSSSTSTPPSELNLSSSSTTTTPPILEEQGKKRSSSITLENNQQQPTPVDNNQQQLNSDNNSIIDIDLEEEEEYKINQTSIEDLSKQLQQDSFFIKENSNNIEVESESLSSSIVINKKPPPPLPPKTFKPTTQQQQQQETMNPNTPPFLSQSQQFQLQQQSPYSSGFSFGRKSGVLPPSEPTYPSESSVSSKRNSVELRYLEDTHSYQLLEKLGSGTFSDVFLCMHKETQKQYAAKIIDKSLVQMIAAHTEMEIATEVNILKASFHPNIISIIDHFETENYYYIITELLNGGELLYQLEKNHHATAPDTQNYTEEHAKKIIKQVVQAVSFLHKNNIVHRDLKPENILFRDKSHCSSLKIIDFGLASQLKASTHSLIDVCGTPEFQAPEMVKREGYSFPVDVWATGVILYILLCGQPPFQGKNSMAIMSLIIKSELNFDLPGWESISDAAKDLIKKMMNPDPATRITCEQILEHPWILESKMDSPQLGSFHKQLRRYNSQRYFKATGDTLLKSQRFGIYSPEKELYKRRSIQM